MLIKNGSYLDSLHVDQEERETATDQAREQIIHKNTAKTPHNADKDWWLP